MAQLFKRSFLVVVVFVFFTEGVSAQKKHTHHQTILPEKEIAVIHIDLVDPWTISPWSSNAILVEININLYHTNQGLNEYLLESDRYLVQTQVNADTLVVTPLISDRNNLKNQEGQTIREEINYKLYMPAIFEQKDTGWLVKKSNP